MLLIQNLFFLHDAPDAITYGTLADITCQCIVNMATYSDPRAGHYVCLSQKGVLWRWWCLAWGADLHAGSSAQELVGIFLLVLLLPNSTVRWTWFRWSRLLRDCRSNLWFWYCGCWSYCFIYWEPRKLSKVLFPKPCVGQTKKKKRKERKDLYVYHSSSTLSAYYSPKLKQRKLQT